MSWFWYKRRSHSPKTVGDWNAPLPEMAGPDEERLAALYAWERRLRGYDLYPSPVQLEPEFVPYDPAISSEEWQRIPQPQDGREGQGRDDTSLVFLSLRLPLEQKVTPAQTMEWLGMLRRLHHSLALELFADERAIRYQLACASSDAMALIAACNHCFPLARIDVTAPAHNDIGGDELLCALTPLAEVPTVLRAVDFGLYHPSYQSLRLFESFTADPHGPLLNALGGLQSGEVAGIQLLMAPAQNAWASSLVLLVSQFEGVRQPAHPNTPDNPLERSLRHKVASPLWAVALRVFAFTSEENPKRSSNENSSEALSDLLAERAFALCRRLGAALEVYSSGEGDVCGDNRSVTQSGNQLVALDDAGYGSRERLSDLLDRRSRRAGMLLSAQEVVGLWHPPSERLTHPKLVRYDPRQRGLPDYLQEVSGAALGYLAADESGVLSPEAHDFPPIVRWPDAMRNRHLYMLGATRMGKSTLLLNMICQDMRAGRGLCLIDPHGDLALDVLGRVPSEREDDTFYLDLSDTAHPPALGLLEASNEWEKRLLVSDLLAILHRLFRASWGDRLEHILRHALLTLLAAESSPFGTVQEPKPLTLRDIRPLLASKEYRQALLERVPDPDLHTFWQSEFPGYTSSAFAPVYNKLGLLLSSPVVRNIIGGSQTKLHAGEVIGKRQILIVNLAQSLIGEDNAHFLGALLVSKIQLAAMHNLRLGRGERTPFTLYVDEFQNFVVSSFEKILSEAGKAGLSLVMANQFLEQLGEGLPTAIRSNTGTLISFRVSAQSGRALEGEFGGLYGAKELTDLERGQAVARLGRAGDSFLIHTFPPLEPETLGADPTAGDYIRQRTYSMLCRSRGEVEAELRASDEALRQLLDQAAEAERGSKTGRTAKAKETNKEVRQAKPQEAQRKSQRPPSLSESKESAKAQKEADTTPEKSKPANNSSPVKVPATEELGDGEQGTIAQPKSPIKPSASQSRKKAPKKREEDVIVVGEVTDSAVVSPIPVDPSQDSKEDRGDEFEFAGREATPIEVGELSPSQEKLPQPPVEPEEAGQMLFFGLPESEAMPEDRSLEGSEQSASDNAAKAFEPPLESAELPEK